jgi:hypothetical protein
LVPEGDQENNHGHRVDGLFAQDGVQASVVINHILRQSAFILIEKPIKDYGFVVLHTMLVLPGVNL